MSSSTTVYEPATVRLNNLAAKLFGQTAEVAYQKPDEVSPHGGPWDIMATLKFLVPVTTDEPNNGEMTLGRGTGNTPADAKDSAARQGLLHLASLYQRDIEANRITY